LIKKLLIIFICLCLVNEVSFAQKLAGFWNGKISRNSGKGYGADNFEVHIYQDGKNLYGYTFAYSDTSRFVLYRFEGKINKKTKLANLEEFGYAFVLLPDSLHPCEKKLELLYSKINNTKYLTGKWSGISIDTTCYPTEELLVALQRIDKPVFSSDFFISKKINHFFRNKQKYLPAQIDTIETQPLEISSSKPDSSIIAPLNRKLDIQQIVSVKDSVIKISLYDNAQIDGDTVSVFVNKKPVIIRQRISGKPLVFTIPFPNKGEAIELLLQAENLGEIPPNTGVMVVEADGKRYEIRVQSDFEKHAVVIFTFVP
jgi:hypothetical protein